MLCQDTILQEDGFQCKQPKCSLADEWIKRTWYIYAMEYYSAIQNNEIMPFVAT